MRHDDDNGVSIIVSTGLQTPPQDCFEGERGRPSSVEDIRSIHLGAIKLQEGGITCWGHGFYFSRLTSGELGCQLG